VPKTAVVADEEVDEEGEDDGGGGCADYHACEGAFAEDVTVIGGCVCCREFGGAGGCSLGAGRGQS
jgi:hypothetical protein